MANELLLGQPRHGKLSDSESVAPDVTATLELTSAGIQLSLVFDHGSSPKYARWFTRDVLSEFLGGGDISSNDHPDPFVPSELLFVDSHGRVALLGCRIAGYNSNQQIGLGRIRVSAVVLGAPTTAHSRIMGMRSEVSGLRSWLGTSAIQESFQQDGSSATVAQRTISLSSPDPIPVPESGLVLRPLYRIRRPTGSLIIENAVWVEHTTDVESSWSVHQSAMRAVRDLLAVSRWLDETLISVSVARTDDSISGKDSESPRLQRWRDVIESDAPKPQEERQRIEHFITWEDLGPGGMSRWIKLREEFARAIDPAVSSLYLNEATIEVHLMQVAISLEALGFVLAIRGGRSNGQANGLNYKRRLDLIVGDVEGLLPFVDSGWTQRMADAYNALKHANRALPRAADVANSWSQSVLLLRAWIASQLGVDKVKLGERIANSPQMGTFVQADEL